MSDETARDRIKEALKGKKRNKDAGNLVSLNSDDIREVTVGIEDSSDSIKALVKGSKAAPGKVVHVEAKDAFDLLDAVEQHDKEVAKEEKAQAKEEAEEEDTGKGKRKK